MNKFRTIMADPPWPEQGGGKTKRGADRHYPLMKVKDIVLMPVADLAEDDAHLYLWTTNNYLEDALEVMKAWGFRYITNIVWVKEGPVGLGQYFRGAHELLLFGVRGMVPYKKDEAGKRCQGKTFYEAPEDDVCTDVVHTPDVIRAPRSTHSTKPDIFRTIVERVSTGPFLELFARRRYENWSAWGNEVPGGNDVELVDGRRWIRPERGQLSSDR